MCRIETRFEDTEIQSDNCCVTLHSVLDQNDPESKSRFILFICEFMNHALAKETSCLQFNPKTFFTEIDDKICSYLVHIVSIHNIAKKKSNLTKERIEIECIVYFCILKDESFVHLTLWQMNLHNDY